MRGRRVQAVVHPRPDEELPVVRGEGVLAVVVLDAERALQHLDVLLLEGVEVLGGFLAPEEVGPLRGVEGDFECEGSLRVGDDAGGDGAVESAGVLVCLSCDSIVSI